MDNETLNTMISNLEAMIKRGEEDIFYQANVAALKGLKDLKELQDAQEAKPMIVEAPYKIIENRIFIRGRDYLIREETKTTIIWYNCFAEKHILIKKTGLTVCSERQNGKNVWHILDANGSCVERLSQDWSYHATMRLAKAAA